MTSPREWLSERHSLRAEALMVLALYGVYEVARGLVVGGEREAVGHAHDVVALERSLNVFVEGSVQDAAQAVPGLIGVLGVSYLTLHLAGTAGVLLWFHRRRPKAFPLVRTTLLLASGLALVGFVAYPTAPPRLAGIGIVDTVSGEHIDLDKGVVSALYNPYAAVPSMHVGYALVVGASVLRSVRRRVVRVAGALYPLLVLLVVVATGNHYLIDAFVGAVIVVVAAGGALVLARPAAEPEPVRLPERQTAARGTERLAA